MAAELMEMEEIRPLATKQVGSIRLEVFEDEQTVGEAAARFLLAQIAEKPHSVFLLPTGRTPLIMYTRLAEKVGSVDLSGVQTFNLDEFYGIPSDHSGNYRSYMQRELFSRVTIPAANIHLLNSAAPDALAECQHYENQLTAAGVDLAVLGIGTNGHIGFNEPGSSFQSRTRPVTIRPETRQANKFLFNDRLDAVPETAITVGIASILQARRILLLATGSGKQQALAGMLYGQVTEVLPASALQTHADVVVFTDKAAAETVL